MTTPQSLTEDDLAFIEATMEIEDFELIEGDTVPERCEPFIKRGSYLSIQTITVNEVGIALMATLWAERERERERVNALAALLADHTQDLILSSPGQETPLWRAYGLPDYEDGIAGTTPIEAMENLANLSPDVLGDQKDKGKATGKGSLTAPEASEELPSSEGSRVAAWWQCEDCGGDDTQQHDCKPSGTIFELDMFRERMERHYNLDTLTGHENSDVRTMAAKGRDDAAELKTLIDNCQAQYAPNGAPENG